MSSESFQISDRERENLRCVSDYSQVQSLPAIWRLAAQRFGDTVALHDPHGTPEVMITYTQLEGKIRQFGAGLQASGIQPGTKIALFADNSPRWLIADQGIICAGAANAVRSSQADIQELIYIFTDSNSTGLVVENLNTFNKLKTALKDSSVELVILLSDEEPGQEENIQVLNFDQLMALGASHELQPIEQDKNTLATLIYTSGTTGKPKGAMLSHGNLLHQVSTLGVIIQPSPGDRVLSILPTWHVYERAAEYFTLAQGCTQIYTNLRSVKKDLQEFKPRYMIGVPRLWESIYEGVQKQLRSQPPTKQKLAQFFFNLSESYITERRVAQNLSLEEPQPSATRRLSAQVKSALMAPLHNLGGKLVYSKIRAATGGRIKAVISGGGSLAKHLDNFYEIIDVTVLVGYGLTETSPVANARRPWHNLRGSSGQPIPGTEIKIVDPETRITLPLRQIGLVLIKGPQVMQGYYQKAEATAKAIDAEGWFDSGDLGYVTPDHDLVLTGRAKDTIVLTNGENIEPQPIEDACVRSAYIDQIMLVGQDQKTLGALIVPNLDALTSWAQEQNLPDSTLINNPQVKKLLRQELNREVKNRPGYRPDDKIGPFELVTEPFTVENGMMTQTLKIKRPVIRENYRAIIDGMFDNR